MWNSFPILIMRLKSISLPVILTLLSLRKLLGYVSFTHAWRNRASCVRGQEMMMGLLGGSSMRKGFGNMMKLALLHFEKINYRIIFIEISCYILCNICTLLIIWDIVLALYIGKEQFYFMFCMLFTWDIMNKYLCCLFLSFFFFL